MATARPLSLCAHAAAWCPSAASCDVTALRPDEDESMWSRAPVSPYNTAPFIDPRYPTAPLDPHSPSIAHYYPITPLYLHITLQPLHIPILPFTPL